MSDSQILQALLFVQKGYQWRSETEVKGACILLPACVRNFGHQRLLCYLLKHEKIQVLTNGKEYPSLQAAVKARSVAVVEILVDCKARNENGCDFFRIYTDESNEKTIRSTFFANFRTCLESLSSKRNFKWTTDADTANVLENLLAPGANVHLRHAQGGFLLHLAARRDDVTIATVLLRKGANIDARTDEGRTPLCVAADLGNLEVLKLLLGRGASVDAVDKSGSTSLHTAARYGHVEACKILLQYKANVNASVLNPIFKGATALQLAIDAGHFQVVELLLMNRANVNALGSFNRSSLLVAVQKGSARIVDSLLNRGVNISDTKNKAAFLAAVQGNSEEWNSIVDSMFQSGFSFNAEDALDSRLLCGAARHRCLATAKKLLDLGADVNGVCLAKGSRKTPLHVAAEYATDGMIVFLLQNGADLHAKCHVGRTPLFYAAEAGHLTAADLLIKSGANVKTQDGQSETALSLVCAKDLPEMARLLLRNGAEVNDRAPVVSAAKRGFLNVVEVLCQFGAQLNVKDAQNRTAIHEAAKFGCCNTVRVLIQNGAEVNSCDGDGRTPLFDAVKEGKFDVVKVLLAFGAKLDVVSRNNETALLFAAEGKWEIFEFLLEYRFTDIGPLGSPDVLSAFKLRPIEDGSGKSYNIMLNHVNKLSKFGLEVNRYDVLLYWFDPVSMKVCKFDWSVAGKNCEVELGLLRSTCVGDTQVFLCDLISKDARQIAHQLRNVSFAQGLQSDFKSMFPNYGKILDHQISKGRERLDIISHSSIISDNLFWEYGTLPFEIVEMILRYLDYREILVLQNICASAK